jgi:hypothetical protein
MLVAHICVPLSSLSGSLLNDIHARVKSGIKQLLVSLYQSIAVFRIKHQIIVQVIYYAVTLLCVHWKTYYKTQSEGPGQNNLFVHAIPPFFVQNWFAPNIA